MTEPAVTTGEILVPAAEFNVIDVRHTGGPDLTRSSGQRFAVGLQHQFSGHNIMGSDGLPEIVALHMSRPQADVFEKGLGGRLEALRARLEARSAPA